MTEPYEVASLSELEIKTGPEAPRWATIRVSLGITAFGVNAWTSERVDQEVIGEHDEVGPRAGRHEELYYVASGHARFTVDGDEIDAPAGTFVFVRDPAAKRKVVSKEEETRILVAGAQPGVAFEPSTWERSARALGYWGTGEFDKAVAELGAAAGEHPEDAGVLYNLACAESRAGRSTDALAHLREAVELDTSFGELAEKDSDFESIREDPEFASAVAGKPKAGGARA
jgi:tetratricopeptide (TPR) repeat protein